jgi:hypothetical protein
MSKKVSFAPKPTAKTADAWVQGGATSAPKKGQGTAPTEAMKRFTIDVPTSLHARIKIACAQRGTKMADEIRTLLEKHFTAD